MATKKNAAATKKKAAKRATARKEIEILIDIGSFEASPAELFRLKEFVNNTVLTWAKYDTRCAASPLVISREGPHPGPQE
jgi:hypothetical protein